jgi:hypothetical protein
MFRLTSRDEIVYLENRAFAKLGLVTHAFCTRRGGGSRAPYATLNTGLLVGDREADVRGNLDRIRGAFAVAEGRLVLMGQVHGDMVAVLDGEGPLPELVPECDGLITARRGVALAIRTADCVPLLFVDPVRRVIGVAHAGWRGTALGLAARMLAHFRQRFASRPEDLLIAVGPAIGPCCYEVDSPVHAALAARPGAEGFFEPCRGKGRWRLDLVMVNYLDLLEAGVPAAHIACARYCTSCRTDLFFSHRAEGVRTGRQISLLMLTDEGGR